MTPSSAPPDRRGRPALPSRAVPGQPRPADPDYRKLFESAPGMFLVLDPDLTIVAVSDAYLAATMTERGRIVGRGLFEVFPDNPDDPGATGASNLRASLDRVRSSLVPDSMAVHKYDIRRPNDEGGGFEERFWSPVNTPVLGPNHALAYIIHRVEDVTEYVRLKNLGTEQQRLTEELRSRSAEIEAEVYRRAQDIARSNRELHQANTEVQRAQTFLDSLIENLPDMVFVKDAQTLRFVRFNRAGEELLGYPRAELIGKNDHDFFPREEADAFSAKDREVLEGRRVVDIPEEPIETARLGRRILHTKKIPILDQHGAPAYLLGISEDITERKQAEDEVRHARHEAERANHAKTEFLSRRVDVLGGVPDHRGSDRALRADQGAPAGGGRHRRLAARDPPDRGQRVQPRLVERIVSRERGMELITATLGRLGVELAREHRPDAVLLNLHLPDMPGHEVLRVLRAYPETRGIPVVVLSADATSRQIAQLTDAGAFGYLTKPLDVGLFPRTIDRATAAEAS